MSILEEIYQYKLSFVKKQKEIISQAEIENKVQSKKHNVVSFYERLINQKDKISIIGEIKRASPSLGQFIHNDRNMVELAKTYEKNNISCLSVLTDKKYFSGGIEDLIEIRKNTSIPILRKDFIVDEYQIYESKLYGADCILIILSMLKKNEAERFANIAKELDMDSIIEVHNLEELHIAKKLNSNMIGINNRNLKNFVTDLNITIQLSKYVNDTNKLLISESGFHSKQDINKIISNTGINNFLIGEFLMKSDNLPLHINELLN